MQHPPQWYDQQYNARAGIPDAPAILQSWAQRSVQTRALAQSSQRCALDVPYSERGRHDSNERLDVFLPTAPTPRGGAPVLVHIHGGYWRALDKSDQSFIAEPFTAAGAVVVVPNYALCPQVSVAHIVMQMVQSLAWTWRHAADYGGDAQRIVVTGHSAGGHLAAMLLACAWPQFAPDLPADLVKTSVPVSGLFDLEPLRHAPFLAADINLSAAEAQRLSPVTFPAPHGKRLLPFVGELESAEFHRQAAQLRQAWGTGVVEQPQSVPGCHHLSVLHALADTRSALNQALCVVLGLEPTR